MASRWSPEHAWEWYNAHPWLVGCNFIPSTAINQIEMWSESTYDEVTIARELGWAAALGFNTIRVYLHDLVWENEKERFLRRIDHFLSLTAAVHIRPILVVFDDCWDSAPAYGQQHTPHPGQHNSGWVQSPGAAVVANQAQWPRLEAYVTALISMFGTDSRVLAWDLYNEAGNFKIGSESLALLRETFRWSRAVNPTQPLTAPVYALEYSREACIELSDVISFHEYEKADVLRRAIEVLRSYGRPLLCTEYMARPDSTFQTHLPIFQEERIACYNWGLVAGRTQTYYSWRSTAEAPASSPWFHDILREDGMPYDPAETRLIRAMTGVPAR